MDGLVRRRSAGQAWPVVDLSVVSVASVVVSVVLASSVVRLEVRLELVPLAAAWSVVSELRAWQVVPVPVPAAWAAQALPRVQPDV
ncbi:hypothetical protein AQJ46_30470 [Streptomyces canus]|uniref:Uncharacterized protein n=1 Tax=Streptomyces canus TaxID=58343 RepID=A0A117R067_9ACTN|nr:hypothetical protein AQJ46_30470 [Streptomyces canus]